MSTTTTSRISPTTRRSTPIVRAGAVVGAAAAALLVWVATVPVLGNVAVRAGADAVRAVGAGAVLATSLVAGLAGWALLAVLERRLAAPGRAWTITALGVLLLSLTGPLTQAATGTWVLLCLHLVVGVVLIPLLAATARW